jgi:MSHA biogenesis protein MshJ
MEKSLHLLMAKLDELELRPRLLVSLAVLAILLFAGYSLLIMLTNKAAPIHSEIESVGANIMTGDVELRQLMESKKFDPNVEMRERIGNLKKGMMSLDARMGRFLGSLIKPTDMTGVLKEVLARETKLTLMRLESLGTEAIVAPRPKSEEEPLKGEPKKSAEQPRKEEPQKGAEQSPKDGAKTGNEQQRKEDAPAFYKHRFLLELEGDYLSALSYLRGLEALPWRLCWDSVTIESIGYPRAHITFKVHTISLQGHMLELGGTDERA